MTNQSESSGRVVTTTNGRTTTTNRLQECFVKLTSRFTRTEEAADHMKVTNHASWLFLNEMNYTD